MNGPYTNVFYDCRIVKRLSLGKTSGFCKEGVAIWNGHVETVDIIPECKQGFLELCVASVGKG